MKTENINGALQSEILSYRVPTLKTGAYRHHKTQPEQDTQQDTIRHTTRQGQDAKRNEMASCAIRRKLDACVDAVHEGSGSTERPSERVREREIEYAQVDLVVQVRLGLELRLVLGSDTRFAKSLRATRLKS